MKLTAITVKQSTSVNLNGLLNLDQMDTKDLSTIAILIRTKLQNTVGKQISLVGSKESC